MHTSLFKSYNWKIQNCSLSIFWSHIVLALNILIPVSFQQVEAILKLPFWYSIKLHYQHFFYYPPNSQISDLRWIFSLWNKKTSHETKSDENQNCCICTIQCFTKKFYQESMEVFFIKFVWTHLDRDKHTSSLYNISCSGVYMSRYHHFIMQITQLSKHLDSNLDV